MLKGFLIAIGVIVVLVLIVGGVGYYLVSRPPEIAKEMRPVEVSTEDAQSFDQKLEAFRAEVEAAAAGEEVKLIITEEELTSKVSASIEKLVEDADLPLGVSDIQINFSMGSAYLLITATVDYEGPAPPVQAGAEVEIDIIEADGGDRLLQYTVNTLSLGALPDWAQRAIRDILLPEGMSGTVAFSELPQELWGLGLEDLPIVLNEVYTLETEAGNQLVFSGIAASEEN